MNVGVLKKIVAICVVLFFEQNIHSIDISFSTRSDIGIGCAMPDNIVEAQFAMGAY
jgi:hypothetical protein